MYIVENCRRYGNVYGYPKNIIVNGTYVNVDSTYDAMYWTERLDMKLYCIAIDTNNEKYKVYRNIEKNLIVAIPDNK